jgi:hypothetical protein
MLKSRQTAQASLHCLFAAHTSHTARTQNHALTAYLNEPAACFHESSPNTKNGSEKLGQEHQPLVTRWRRPQREHKKINSIRGKRGLTEATRNKYSKPSIKRIYHPRHHRISVTGTIISRIVGAQPLQGGSAQLRKILNSSMRAHLLQRSCTMSGANANDKSASRGACSCQP